MRLKLIAAGIRMNFETYIGLITSISIAIGLISLLFSSVLTYSFTRDIQTVILNSIISISIAVPVTILICYSLPYLLADNRSKIIDATLPNIANYMAILATTGMNMGNILSSLGRVGEEFNIQAEMDIVITDIEILGFDIYKALRHAYEVSSSKNFANLLFGVVSTSQMGGDLASYLKNQAEKNTNKRLLSMRGFIDNLAIIAEIYITIMVVGPLMLIVMLSVMSFIGGGISMGGLSVSFIMDILTFVFIPLGILVLILAVEATNPVR